MLNHLTAAAVRIWAYDFPWHLIVSLLLGVAVAIVVGYLLVRLTRRLMLASIITTVLMLALTTPVVISAASDPADHLQQWVAANYDQSVTWVQAAELKHGDTVLLTVDGEELAVRAMTTIDGQMFHLVDARTLTPLDEH